MLNVRNIFARNGEMQARCKSTGSFCLTSSYVKLVFDRSIVQEMHFIRPRDNGLDIASKIQNRAMMQQNRIGLVEALLHNKELRRYPGECRLHSLYCIALDSFCLTL